MKLIDKYFWHITGVFMVVFVFMDSIRALVPFGYAVLMCGLFYYNYFNLSSELTSYLQKTHLKFYDCHKNYPLIFGEKCVNLKDVSDTSIIRLNDLKVLEFKKEILVQHSVFKKSILVFFSMILVIIILTVI